MALLQRQFATQRMQQKADPQLLLTNKLLQMSRMELHQSLATEILDNPALEEDEFPCDRCEVAGPGCIGCPYNSAEFRAQSVDSNRDGAGEVGRWDDADPFSTVESPVVLADHLRIELRAVAAGEVLHVGEHLIDNLDPDGYLRCELEECAASYGCDLDLAEQALQRVQSLDPAGVGARSLWECLVLQAENREAEGSLPPYVMPLLRRYWKQFTSGRYRQIARRLRCTEAEVLTAVEFIRAQLSPYPGRQFRPRWDRHGHRSATAIQPDVIMYFDEEGELVAELTSRVDLTVHVSDAFVKVWRQMRERPQDFDPGEVRQVQDYMNRASMFLKSLQDRKAILKQVADCILEEQATYIRTERDEDLRPMTQSRLAMFLHVHESTVSRGVADKYAQLPSGRVVTLQFFFDRSLGARKLIADIIDQEDPSRPFSDQEISDTLGERGVQIARRTVMKYREEMKILSSRQRLRHGAHEGRRLAA